MHGEPRSGVTQAVGWKLTWYDQVKSFRMQLLACWVRQPARVAAYLVGFGLEAGRARSVHEGGAILVMKALQLLCTETSCCNATASHEFWG